MPGYSEKVRAATCASPLQALQRALTDDEERGTSGVVLGFFGCCSKRSKGTSSGSTIIGVPRSHSVQRE